MFAILISEENLPKIREHQETLPVSQQHILERVYLNAPSNWYYVQGVLDASQNLSWSAIPQNFLDKLYEHDPNVIQTDWDQIVKK